MAEQQQQQQQGEEQGERGFDRAAVVRYMRRVASGLPSQAESQDNNHLTLIYFALAGLDLLGEPLPEQAREGLADYIYSLQVLPRGAGDAARCGFLGTPADPAGPSAHESASIAMAYVALALLRMVGDDMRRLDRAALAGALRGLQRADGSFGAVGLPGKGEADLRFVFCASAVAYMAGDWSGVDRDAAAAFVLRSQSYEGAFGQGPLQESHGGSTYCAVAALALMDRLHLLPAARRADLVRWLCARQVGGFQGRVNKPADSCYSFWIGGALAILGHRDLLAPLPLSSFICACQHPSGGFSKHPGGFPDPLHTYYSLCGLGLAGEPGIQPMVYSLSLTKRAVGDWPLDA